jgi:RNA polymerase sigma-70 factor, ECF subfamily
LKSNLQNEEQLLLEEQIIKKAQGDPAAFRTIYEKYYKKIFVFIFHRVGEKDQTADLTSQVFLKALQKLHQFQFRGLPFSAWLFRIAVNECNDFFRKTKRDRLIVLEEHHAEFLYEEMFGQNVLTELKRKLPFVLSRLKEPELQIIELRFLEGRSFRDVAEILDMTETYAKVRTYRILEKMKKLFQAHEK